MGAIAGATVAAGVLGAGATAAGGIMASKGAKVPSIGKLLGSLSTNFFGQLKPGEQEKMDALLAIPEGQRTPQQVRELADYQTKLDRTRSFAETFSKYLEEWQPVYDQREIERIQQNAPGLAQARLNIFEEFGPQFAQAIQKTQEQLAPEYFGLRRGLASQLEQGLGKGLTEGEQAFFREKVREGQASRGLFDSPLGSVQESYALTELESSRRQQNILNVQNFLNAFPVPGVQDVGLPTLPTQAMFQQISPSEILQARMGIASANTAASLASQQQTSSILGNVGGTLLGGAFRSILDRQPKASTGYDAFASAIAPQGL